MSFSPLFSVLAFAAISSVASQGNEVDQGVQPIAAAEEDFQARPLYEFIYEVGPKDFGHTESRDGGRTWGSYFQRLPDGRLQTVKYWADDSGYHAEVEYAGKANPWEGPEVEVQKEEVRVTPQFSALLESFPTEAPKRGEGKGQPVLRPIPIEIYTKRKGTR